MIFSSRSRWVVAGLLAMSSLSHSPGAMSASGAESARERSARFSPTTASQFLENGRVQHHWIPGTDRLWYVRTRDRQEEIVVWDAPAGRAIHQQKLSAIAAALGKTAAVDVAPGALVGRDTTVDGSGHLKVHVADRNWSCSLASLKCEAHEAGKVFAEPNDLIAPDGRWAVFRRDYNLWLRDLRTGEVRALTKDGVKDFGYAQEADTSLDTVEHQISGAQAPVIAAWSPDSRRVLVNRIDQRAIPTATVTQYVPPDQLTPRVYSYKYAFIVDPARAQEDLLAIDVASGDTIKVTPEPLRVTAFCNLGWNLAWWGPDGQTVYFIRSSQGEKQVTLFSSDARTGTARQLLEESADTRVEVRSALAILPNVRVLSNGDVIWYSERDDWGHLYLYDKHGRLKNRITQGSWQVREIIRVDEASKRVYFVAGGIDAAADPYFIQLASVGLDGTGLKVLTPEPVNHDVPSYRWRGQNDPLTYAFSPSGKYFVATASTPSTPPRLTVRSARGEQVKVLEQARLREPILGTLRMPERIKLQSSDGSTAIYANVYRPSDFDAARRYPVIDHIYAGPQATLASPEFTWAVFGRAQALAELGFVVIELDARGTPFRSRSMRDFTYGKADLVGAIGDHVSAIKQLAARYAYLDLTRVGIIGSSQGGYAAVQSMLTYPEFFKVGVSIAGAHDSRVYLPFVGEVWQGLAPGQTYAQVLEPAALRTSAAKLAGKLLIIAADTDENVQLGNVLSLTDALIRADKDFDFLLVTNANHNTVGMLPYVVRRFGDYFVRHLAGGDSEAQ